jgi:hypothetical protein
MFLQSPVTSSLLGPNFLLSTPFSKHFQSMFLLKHDSKIQIHTKIKIILLFPGISLKISDPTYQE